jgi:hypothetical protein
VRVLAGGVLDRGVRSIRAVHDLGEAYVVERDELVMVLEPTTLDDWRMDTLLRRIASAEGIGVLLRAGPPFESTCQLAGRLGLVLLETLAEPLDLLVDARVALAQPALERAELLLAAFDELTGRLDPPADVVDRLSALVDAPVGLLDDGGGLLAGAVSHVDQLRLRTAEPQQIELGDALVLAHPARLPQATRPSHWLTVSLSGSARARAISVASVLRVAAAAVERWLLIHRVEHERSARARAALLGDLLRSTGEPPADLRSRAADAGWQLAGWHVGFRIETPSTLDNVARRPDVADVLRAEGINAVIVEHGDGWTGWTTFAQEPLTADVRAIADRLRSAQHVLQRVVLARMGVGRLHPHADGLVRTTAEATDAARLAATRPENGHFLHVDKLGMSQLLLEWTRTDTFEPAARALVAPLLGVPGDLVRTLGAYLDAESSIAETAAVLGIHRNTVVGRLKRIERLLTVDLAHRDDRLAVHLACRTVVLADE